MHWGRTPRGEVRPIATTQLLRCVACVAVVIVAAALSSAAPQVDSEDSDSWEEVTAVTVHTQASCGKVCTDPNRWGKQTWSWRCQKKSCKGCTNCVKPGPPDPAPTPAPEQATRRRRGKGPSRKDPGRKLVWSDEFDDKSCSNGRPGPHWIYETGFVRNEEHQWYQKDNARCVDGKLVIRSGKHAPGERMNPDYKAGSKNWKHSRKHIIYTSSSLTTQGKRSFGLGVFEMRGKVDIREGAWPAWWTLGTNINQKGWNWPRSGEIDMMELFGKAPWARGPELKANVIYGTSGRWDYKLHRYIPGKRTIASESNAVDAKWGDQWHVWKMERTATHIKLYVDDKLLNNFNINIDEKAKETFAADKEIFMIVNLALGGCCGGNPDTNKGAPFKLEIDYIRVYEN